MATIDLGKIKLVWRGTYAAGTAYTVDDVVAHTDGGITSSFICTTASTGNAPSTGGTVHGSWAYLAKGGAAGTNGTDGTDVGTVITTAGDLLYRDGSGLQRLAKGTASQVLTMNSGATAPEWAAAAGGGLDYNGGSGGTQNVWYSISSSAVTISNSSAWEDVMNLTLPQLSVATRYFVTYTEDRREQNWNATSGRYQNSDDNGSNWTTMGETFSSWRAAGDPGTAVGNDIYQLHSASYVISFAANNTPKFRIQGTKFGNSNQYRSGGQRGYNSIVAIEIKS